VYLPVVLIRDFLEEVRGDPPARLDGRPVTGVVEKDGVKYLLGEQGWLLHRLSGTEPMVRLYCEHVDAQAVERILDAAEQRLSAFARARAGC
jgi:phosphomannomutase